MTRILGTLGDNPGRNKGRYRSKPRRVNTKEGEKSRGEKCKRNLEKWSANPSLDIGEEFKLITFNWKGYELRLPGEGRACLLTAARGVCEGGDGMGASKREKGDFLRSRAIGGI